MNRRSFIKAGACAPFVGMIAWLTAKAKKKREPEWANGELPKVGDEYPGPYCDCEIVMVRDWRCCEPWHCSQCNRWNVRGVVEGGFAGRFTPDEVRAIEGRIRA